MKNQLFETIVRKTANCCTIVIAGILFVSLGFGNLGNSVAKAQNHVTEQADAKVELVADGFKFTEGPAVDSKGNVYFTDQPNDRIMKVDLEGKVTEFLKPSGRSNGLFFTKDDTLIACADEKNEMWAINLDGSYKVLFKDFEGNKLNGPNDVWIDSTGFLYFTDPYYQRPWWTHKQPPQKSRSVYRVDPDGENITCVDDALKQPNGIVGDARKRILYVADINDNKIYRYNIAKDGTLLDRTLFCSHPSDGMTLDSAGHLYITNSEGVSVFNEAGERVQVIPTGKGWTANVCLGGEDRKTLFITASDALFKIRVKHSGLTHE